MKQTKKGFTLVELVIVIAIIGILAGVFIPTFTGIANKAREAVASQQAASAMQVVLAAKDGILTNGTVFGVDTNEDGVVDYRYIFKDQSLQTTEADDQAKETDMDSGEYDVYVSERAIETKDGKTTLKVDVAKRLASLTGKNLAEETTALELTKANDSTYTWSYQIDGTKTVKYNISFDADIPETTVVVIAPAED